MNIDDGTDGCPKKVIVNKSQEKARQGNSVFLIRDNVLSVNSKLKN